MTGDAREYLHERALQRARDAAQPPLLAHDHAHRPGAAVARRVRNALPDDEAGRD